MKKCGWCLRRNEDNATKCFCGWMFPNGVIDELTARVVANVRAMTTDTVPCNDISFWQRHPTDPAIDFVKMSSISRGVWIRRGQAKRKDRDGDRNHADARGKIARGVYWYFDWTVDFVAQVDYIFVEVIKTLDDLGELPFMLDYEEWEGAPSPGTARLQLRAAIERIEYHLRRLGWDMSRKILLYTGNGYWRVYGSSDLWWSLHCDLAIAHYGVVTPIVPLPWTRNTYRVHQWGFGDGIAHGVYSLEIDMDNFNGTVIEWLEYALPLPGAPDPDPEPIEEIMQKWKVVTTELSVRNKPKDMDGSVVITKAPAGTVFVGTGKQIVKPEWPHQHWVEINYNGGVAWIADLYYANGIPLAVTVS